MDGLAHEITVPVEANGSVRPPADDKWRREQKAFYWLLGGCCRRIAVSTSPSMMGR